MNKKVKSIFKFKTINYRKVIGISIAFLFFILYLSVNEGQARGILSTVSRLMSKRLIRNINTQLQRVERGMSELEDENKTYLTHTKRNERDETNWAFYLQRIRLRIRPRVSFQIPGVSQFRIAAFAELEYTKRNPDGWEDYRPR